MDVANSGVFALVGALSVVLITQRYTVRLERERRSEARRDSQHRAVAEMLAAGFAKVELYRPSIPIFSQYSASPEAWSKALKAEIDDRLVRTNSEFRLASAQAAMLAGDQRILACLADVRRRDAAFSDDVVTAAMGGDVETAVANLRAFRTALMDLEATAVELLRVSMKPSQSLWQLLWRRRDGRLRWYVPFRG